MGFKRQIDPRTLLRGTATSLGGDQLSTQLSQTRLQETQMTSSGLVLLRSGHLEDKTDSW